MSKNEIEIFIEEMEMLGDVWEPADVERVYGDKSLDEALTERKSMLGDFGNIINMILNN